MSRAVTALREVLETKIEDIDSRLHRLEPMLFERLAATMETSNALYSEKFLAVHTEIDALRLLKTHDLASMTERFTVQISDEGSGFSFESLPDPLAPENLLRGSGRGIFLIRSFMDEVHFRQLQPGTELTLIKHLGTARSAI